MPGRKDAHANQARTFAIVAVALMCLVVIGALALTG